METVFDIGMYDGADTRYYLDLGFRVIAVDANPEMCEEAHKAFASEIARGQVHVLNTAVGPVGHVELTICGTDAGSSSIIPGRLDDRKPGATFTVPSVPLSELVERYGVPKFIKIDVEGADAICVDSLKKGSCPQFLSFEAHDDFEPMMAKAEALGYRQFKIIDQIHFRSLQRQDNLRDRIVLGLFRRLGFSRPVRIERAGRFFASGHSSGPVPWASDDRWYSAADTRRAWAAHTDEGRWYDVQARL